MRFRASFAVAFLLAGGIDGATTLDELERGVHDAAQLRESLAQERRSLRMEAAAVADTISRIKRRESTPRADSELERHLRGFDRLVRALDDLDRRIKTQERTIDQTRRRFEQQADAEMALLSARRGDGASLAARVEMIEAAVRRVRRDAAQEPSVRPALDIVLEPNDGPAEIRVKLALLKAERRRFADLMVTFDQEITVVETRIAIKRQLAREVEAVSAEAVVGLSLLQRESDDLYQAIQEMERRRKKLVADRAGLPRVLLKLDERIESLVEKERELTATTRIQEAP
jgi:soluble cytochrome b562